MKYVPVYQWSLKKKLLLSNQKKFLFLVFKLTTQHPVISYPITNNTGTAVNTSPTGVTEILPPTGFTLISGTIKPLQVPKKLFEAILILIIIHLYLKRLHLNKIFLMQRTVIFTSKVLKRFHFCKLIELREEYGCIIHSVMTKINFKIFQL